MTVSEDGAAAGRERRRRVPSIGFYLLLLVSVIILPAVLFTALLLDRNGNAQRDRIETLAAATAGSISEAVDRELLGMLTTLRVLATAESLYDGDLRGFHARARAALSESKAHVILVAPDNQQLLNTRVQFGETLGPISDLEAAGTARQSGRGVVSNAFFGRTADRWVFNVTLPLADGRLLIMTQDAENLVDVMSQQNLRGGWNVAVVDQKGVVLSSSYTSFDIGQTFFLGPAPISGRLFATAEQGGRQEEFATAVMASGLSGWRVVVWAPAGVVDDPLRRSILTLMFGALTVGILAAGAAWLIGRQISQPIRRLARDAGRLGAGEEVKAIDYPVAEISTVSSALAKASKDRRAAENEIRFLMREVAHRSKNQLTVVSSIAKQSARNARGFAAFQDAFQKRLLGLARSTDLLIAGGVAGVDLRELMAAQIEPFQPSDASRVELNGPSFRLENQAAQTIGLATHELATNAAKYGAFAKTNGKLVVEWTIEAGTLVIHWREFAGRLPRRQETRGFGTEVIERMLGRALDAGIERTLHRDGLEYRFVLPLEKVRADANTKAANEAG